MLIAYDDAGTVFWNSGTNTAYPEGPPDEAVVLSVGRDDLSILRLHDTDDAELVQAALTHDVTVRDGKLVIGEPIAAPSPEPEPVPTVEYVTRDEFNELLTMFLEG